MNGCGRFVTPMRRMGGIRTSHVGTRSRGRQRQRAAAVFQKQEVPRELTSVNQNRALWVDLLLEERAWGTRSDRDPVHQDLAYAPKSENISEVLA